MVEKKWLFEQDGRPAIYQPDDEFELLPESQRWRHVRYEPCRNPPIDFSWEREWRVHTDTLAFNPSVASVIVKDESWADRLFHEHRLEQEWRLREYALIFDEEFAENFYEPFVWNIFTLK